MYCYIVNSLQIYKYPLFSVSVQQGPTSRLSIPCIFTTLSSHEMSINRGVYTDPAHNLYVVDAEPAAGTVPSGSTLQPGEVTIAIKSSGICG